MAGPADERALLELLRAGNQDAAQQVFDQYAASLLRLARWRMSTRLARRIDPEDIVQSAFRVFFSDIKAGKFTVAERHDLGKILVKITLHKVLRQVALHTAAKRDCAMETEAGTGSTSGLSQVQDLNPSPEAGAAFLDQLEHFLSRLSPQESRVLEMRLQDYGTLEIARALDMSDRQVRRILEHIRAVADQENIGA
jgi:RNA polymerase sigma-70 factor (ECF subfamily)